MTERLPGSLWNNLTRRNRCMKNPEYYKLKCLSLLYNFVKMNPFTGILKGFVNF